MYVQLVAAFLFDPQCVEISAGEKNVRLTKWNKKALFHNDHAERRLAVASALAEQVVRQAAESGTDVNSKQSKREVEQLVETRVIQMRERIRRATTYEPYTTNPYNLGALSQCSRPSVGRCIFSSDVMVPEYTARLLRSLASSFNTLLDLLDAQSNVLALTSSECLSAIKTYICDAVATPRCIGNDMVSFAASSQEVKIRIHIAISIIINLITIIDIIDILL